MNRTYLIRQFSIAKENKNGICVELEMPGQETTEKIINDYEALDNKLNYYLEAYDDLLVHNHCGDIIIADVYPCDFTIGGINMEDKYVETIEAGAGSYPEQPESKEKCYQFEFNASIRGYGVVYAKDEREAKEFAESGNYDDIIDTWDMKIEEITSVRED